MKANIIGIIIALMLAFAGVISVWGQDTKVSEVRKVDTFSSIEVNSVAEIYFTQADHCSFTIEGKEKYVKLITSTVKNGRLIIGSPKGTRIRNMKKGVTIHLTAPDLKQVDFSGVGTFFCEEPLKLDNIDFNISGVGSMEVAELVCRNLTVNLSGIGSAELKVDCEHLDANVSGIGGLTLSGKTHYANISSSGIGSVDRDDLKVVGD